MKPFLTTLVALSALAGAGPALAWNCAYEKNLEAALDLAGSERLAVAAAAGDLRITGHSDGDVAIVRGKVCASEEEWLDEAEIVTTGGASARIEVALPDASGWSLVGSRYVYMDLEIQVPEGLALDVRDSSGDAEIRGTGPLTVQDSSGDLEIREVDGAVELDDSSGDIDLVEIAGDVTVRSDSSGDIDGRDIGGSVRVERDSSGEIRFEDVKGDFVVERDSSGDIVADTIGGDFRVLRDGSGAVRSREVTGEVEVPDQG